MCGFAGFLYSKPSKSADAMARLGVAMGEAIIHRGPDTGDVWLDAEAGICLSHRRLSIIDLSEAGSQPMASESGRYVIAYNGEIYNFEELRPQLSQDHWRGHSDTEVLLAAIEQWGVHKTLKQLDGMFAFALWDKQARELTIARDRMGEKPLYYGYQGEAFLFGSELKALREHPAWEGHIDPTVLPLFLRHNYIPAPHSIYRAIQKLLPGHYAVLSAGGDAKAVPYYHAPSDIKQAPTQRSDAEALEELEQLLSHSIKKRMISDVPLGAFLSGGIDSSAIVALMQAQSNNPIHSFTMGFEIEGYNEADHARAVADHLGTHHTEMMVTPDDARNVIPSLPDMYDEPFADVSQIPTHMVSRMARQHVTVTLSGDAGDELFAGYNRYFWGTSIWNKMRYMPHPLRVLLAKSVRAIPIGGWDSIYSAANRIRPMGQKNVGEKMHKLSRILDARDEQQLYRRLVSQWQDPQSALRSKVEPQSLLANPPFGVDDTGFMRWMQGMDMLTYLPDDILCKVDRAAMGVSLETRIPFLDPAVVSFAMSLHANQCVRDGKGKWLLRELLYKHVPHELIERPKMGFGVPIDHWLRNELKDWADALLDPAQLDSEGFFDAQTVRAVWDAHQSGKVNTQYQLWPILMFQMWKARYV